MFDIGLPEFEIINRETNENEDYIYYVTVKNSPTECPECGSTHIVKHKKRERKVRDLNRPVRKLSFISIQNLCMVKNYVKILLLSANVSKPLFEVSEQV